MSSPFASFPNREVVELPTDVTKRLRFRAPIDFYSATITNREGASVPVRGLTFHVVEEDGRMVEKPLNVISKRLLAALAPYEADGRIFKLLLTITARGEPPKTEFEVLASPV